MRTAFQNLDTRADIRIRGAALASIGVIFVFFTWRGLLMFYNGDDLMNTYSAWVLNPWRLGRAQVFPWVPVYRPLGGLIYRLFYQLCGFHPEPLYVFCWLLLLANLFVAFRFFGELSATPAEALIALAIIFVHGAFQELYLSAGTLYDRLCFLFTALAVAFYAKLRRTRSDIPRASAALVCCLFLLALNSKESGLAVAPILACWELIFVLPKFWRKQARTWLRAIAPLYGALAIISAAFIFGRLRRTPELVNTPTYHPHVSLWGWLMHVSEYAAMLAYNHAHPSPAWTGWALLIMLAVALSLGDRVMLFGWLFFVIAITPVASISSRPGYVLYVPCLGLGLYFGAVFSGGARFFARRLRWPPVSAELAAFVLLLGGATWLHARNWPTDQGPFGSPIYRNLSEQLRREYPSLPKGSKLLFESDYLAPDSWDFLFDVRLLYGDRDLVANRLHGLREQQPDWTRPLQYDHIFSADSGRYVELDPANPRESIRLHIVRDYEVGSQVDFSRRDHPAYVVSGVLDDPANAPSRWTTRHAALKFDVHPANSVFSAKFWIPEFVAAPPLRTLSILVDGEAIGSVPLSRTGMNDVSFPAPAHLLRAGQFTLVDLVVDHPYKQDGQEFGVVLLTAGFHYK
ncbi:MAG TPA: hypothetical protein VH639_30330 [Bryobacteraceae bacterium]|jgi:hypothetical protein